MAKKKSNDGVIATIERLTKKTPCPDYLRGSLNKYLYQGQLFDGASDGKYGNGRKRGALRAPHTDNLVCNLLDLDGLFCGETSTVVDVITGEIDAGELARQLDIAERTMRQRFNIYAYWLERLPAVRTILQDRSVDLRAGRLDERLAASSERTAPPIPQFALHALRIHEASEAKGRTGLPTPSEYVERAQGYLALDDLAGAERNACAAIAQDPACARAWFLRVAVALRRRNTAATTFQRKRIEAQELAEPLSSHEQWANEQADDAADEASRHQQSLDSILPQAILHWPRKAGKPEHRDLWQQVRALFVRRMFDLAARDIWRHETWEQWAESNGLQSEWTLERARRQYLSSKGKTGGSPFSDAESGAIQSLLDDYDAGPDEFFKYFDPDRLGIDFRLYHLRYVQRVAGGKQHWDVLQGAIAISGGAAQSEHLLHDPVVARLWQAHCCRHGDESGLMAFYGQWMRKDEENSGAVRHHTILRQYAYLYHRHVAHARFGDCADVAARAVALFEGADSLAGWFANVDHPYDESIGMPLHRSEYWHYLLALAVVMQRKESEPLSPAGQAILAAQGSWQTRLSQQQACLWMVSEEYDGGGGEDWYEPPYGIDLRTARGWAGQAPEPSTPPAPVSLSARD